MTFMNRVRDGSADQRTAGLTSGDRLTGTGLQAKRALKKRRFLKTRPLGKQGSIAIFVALAIPPLILLGGTAVEQGYLLYRHELLKRTSQAAALAGQTYLADYYAAGGTYTTASMANINSVVQTIVSGSMPSANFGTVVPTTASNGTSSVQLGTWDNTTKTFTVTTTKPDAVQVTARNTVLNGNPINTMFMGMIGKPTVELSETSVASWGNGLSNAGGFNTIIVNDLSGSFSSEIANQRAVDIAILNCISSGTNGNGKVGLTTFGGDPWMQNAASLAGFPTQTSYRASPYQAYLASAYTGTLALATAANIGTMTRFINNTLNYCGSSGMQPCSGSNVSSGLYSAIKQLQAQNIANPSSNIILISDGVPNATARTYSTDDGAIPTPSASINTTYGWNGCTSGANACTDTSFWNATQAWAAYAGSLGINVSTVYYSGSTSDATSVATYTAMLASLVKNNGTALVAPNPSSIDVAFAKFCSSMGAAVKKVS